MDVRQGTRVPRSRPHDHLTRPVRATIDIRGGGGVAVCGGGGSQPGPTPPLHWCDGCGDRVQRLGPSGVCALCEEVDLRLEAHIGSAMADLAERAVELALCYLHPDDVREIVERVAGEREPAAPPLRDVFDRSHAFVAARERRARGVSAGDPPPGG
jgi:hypothetical protein